MQISKTRNKNKINSLAGTPVNLEKKIDDFKIHLESTPNSAQKNVQKLAEKIPNTMWKISHQI